MLLKLHTTPVGRQVMIGLGRAWMSAGAMDGSMLRGRTLTTGVLLALCCIVLSLIFLHHRQTVLYQVEGSWLDELLAKQNQAACSTCVQHSTSACSNLSFKHLYKT